MTVINNTFWRLEPGGDVAATLRSPVLTAPPELIAKVKRGNGIVLGTWNEDATEGRVHALGVVEGIDARGATVTWRPVTLTLRPSGSGATQWRTRPFFKFNEVVADRYRLMDHFRSAFATTNTDSAHHPHPPAEPPPVRAAVPTRPRPRQPVENPRQAPRDRQPQTNRVAPTGEIFATPARGMFMGNRTSPPRWLVCELHFERNLKEPRKYVKLFFLDEAVALAAGHRPCMTCRRDRYREYLAAVSADIGVRDAAGLDRLLHAARTAAPARSRIDSLPDGAFVMLADGDYRLAWSGALHRWTPHGYVTPTETSGLRAQEATVLTPEPSLAALRNGYVPVVHDSAGR